MVNPYQNLNNPGQIGQQFTQAFQQGQQQAKQRNTDNALMQYALNPNDPKATEGVIKADPRMGLHLRQQQQEQQQKLLEANRDKIKLGAQIIGAVKPQDDAGWKQALAIAQQAGLDTSHLPQNFDPQFVQNLIQIDQALNPRKQDSQPSSVEEFQFAQQQGFAGSYMDFMEEKRGPIVAANGDGTFQIIPRGMVGGQQQAQAGPQPGQVEDGYRFKGGNPADPNAWEQVSGGPTLGASGGFPGN